MMSTMMKTMLVAALATTGVSADGGKVLELDDSNFDSTVAENPTTLVEFFAPWCGHCKALAPEYAKAAEELEGKNAGKLASVDCTEHKELCNKYGVRGFPTLKLFRNDGSEPSDYDQARKADALVKFMVKQNSPAVQEVTDVASFAPGEAVRVVAFVDADTDLAEYTKVAQALRNEYNFGVVRGNAEAAAAAKVTVPGVAVLRNFDEGDVAFSGAAFGGASFGEELTSFIKAQSFPLVGEIGPENYSKYLDRGFPFVWLFVDKSSDEQTRFVNDVAAVVAKDFRDSLSFVKLDGIKWAEHAKSFGLPGTTPGIAIEDRGRRKNYLFPEGGQLAVADFGEFVRGYAAGTLAANVKSEPVPEPNDAPVTVVVGKTFDKIVLDEAKDVLVEFYAPWCGHCKSLAPKYDELGAKYAGDDNVVIAKIDATANDHPADVQGFPTILFYPAGSDKTAVEFNGARTVDSMAEFIENNRKSSPGAAKKAAAAAEHGADHADL